MHEALVILTPFPEEETVIRRKHNRGIVQLTYT